MVDITKVANLILYFLHKGVKNLNHKKIELLIFFIEKNHLDFCGKKILNENFIKTPRGVKAEVLDELFNTIIDDIQFDNEEDDDMVFFIQELMDFLDIEIIDKSTYKELKFSKLDEDFDESIFTESEIRTVTKIINLYKDISVRNLTNECFTLDSVRAKTDDEVVL